MDQVLYTGFHQILSDFETFLDQTKKLIETNTFHYGLPDVRAIPFVSGPGNANIQFWGIFNFWHTAAQAEPPGGPARRPGTSGTGRHSGA